MVKMTGSIAEVPAQRAAWFRRGRLLLYIPGPFSPHRSPCYTVQGRGDAVSLTGAPRPTVMEPHDSLIYFPSRYHPPLGHGGFEVRLAGAPGDRYFDARRVLLPIEQGGALRRLAVEHPYRLAEEVRFVSGRIRLEAFDGDVIEIVTFGGRAHITTEGDQTAVRVESSAPFLPLTDDPESPFVILESELEAVLAQSRAGWGRDEYRHLDRLGEVEPMTLFVAAIATLDERLTRLARADEDEATRAALHLVRHIRQTLEKAAEWPVDATDLNHLL